MVLTDSDIKQALADDRLIIDPNPDEGQYDPTAVDLRLGSEFFRWHLEEEEERFGETPAIRIAQYDYTSLAEAFQQRIEPDADGCVTIGRNEFLLTTTLERVGFPAGGGLAGRVEGKSSLARLGLSVHLAPTLHHSWVGKITLELQNVGPAPLKLDPGAKVCQLIVETISGESETDMAGTRFQEQETPRGRSPS